MDTFTVASREFIVKNVGNTGFGLKSERTG